MRHFRIIRTHLTICRKMLEENIQHQHSTCIFCKNSRRSGYLFPLLRSHRKIFVSPCDLTEQLDSFCVTRKIFFKSQSFSIEVKKIKVSLIMINEGNIIFRLLDFHLMPYPVKRMCCLFSGPVIICAHIMYTDLLH